MKKSITALIIIAAILSLSVSAFANQPQTLDDIVGNAAKVEESNNLEAGEPNKSNAGNEVNSVDQDVEVIGSQIKENQTTQTSNNTNDTETKASENPGHDFINGNNGLIYAPDVTDVDTSGAEIIVNGARTIAGYIVVILSYIIVTFMVVRIMLDLTFITLPFTRTFLANGYSGNAQSSGQGMQNMAGGMPGMGGFNTGFRGMNSGMRVGMPNQNPMNAMAGQNAMINRNSSIAGNVQLVSNAALNAAATESSVGPDGKTINPYTVYLKDMTVTLVCVPVLIVLASTGALAQFGFALGNILTDLLVKASSIL